MLTVIHFLLLLHLSASANSAAPSPRNRATLCCPHVPLAGRPLRLRPRPLPLPLRPYPPAPPPSSSPSALARAAALASLSATRAAAAFLARAPSSPSTPAYRDCARILLDAAEQLARATDQLGRLRPGGAGSHTRLGNAQTWTSAAMTDQDMCTRGIVGLAEPTRDAVAARVAVASRFTSNALYLITRLASTSGGRNR